ncbi:MAG: prolyl oligopeptidase family serine peptidase [bacterium]|nr:prolyl oligopeptidase family serine peptidase [bacterium]
MQKKYSHISTGQGSIMNYIVYYPEILKDGLPLLLFLHGIGERGSKIEDIEKYALPKYMNKFDIPYIVVAPQCSESNFWDYHIRDVEIILKEVYKEYKYNKKRVCILGSSMGAFGAWNYLISRPNLFKGIVSVSGGIMLAIPTTLENIKDKKILIYHGDQDDVVSVENSYQAYNALKKMGVSNIELKIVENDNHYLTSHAFKDKYLYDWLEKKNIRS